MMPAPARSSASPFPDRRPLRVLQCITRLGLGGSEQVALALTRLVPGCESAVFTAYQDIVDAPGREMAAELSARHMPWYAGTNVPVKRGGLLPAGLALRRAVAAFQPDVIHLHAEVPEACAAVALALPGRAARTPVVRTIHNCVFWRFWPRLGRWTDRRLARAHVACVSAAARDEFLRYRAESGAGAPPGEPAIIYNGVARPRLTPHALPRQPGLRRVLFAGRFEEQKGLDLLCAAIPHVRLPPHTHGELLIVGDGPLYRHARHLARHPPSTWRVGVQAPVGDLSALFPAFDVVVMPSRFEGLGLVAIEATLAGLPLVASDAPGLREVLPLDHPWRPRPGDAGDLVNALSAALTDTPRWAAAVVAAQNLAEARFNPGAMGAAYRRLYLRALGPTVSRVA